MHDLTTIWQEVSGWPPEQRLELAERLLQSLRREEKQAAAFEGRPEALRQLVGIWKTDRPPNDEQVGRMLEEERLRKYG